MDNPKNTPLNEPPDHELKASLSALCSSPANPSKQLENEIWEKVRASSCHTHKQKFATPVVLSTSRKFGIWMGAAAAAAVVLIAGGMVVYRRDPTWDMVVASARPIGKNEEYVSSTPQSSYGKKIHSAKGMKGKYETRSDAHSHELPPADYEVLSRESVNRPADPSSKDGSEIVVKNLPAKAELGGRFEDINLDRPDAHSALGNPDAHMFHVKKDTVVAGAGGGFGGTALDEKINAAGSFGTKIGINEQTGFGCPEDVVKQPRTVDAFDKPLSTLHAPALGDDVSEASKKIQSGHSIEEDRIIPTHKEESSKRDYANLQEIRPNVEILRGGIQDDNRDFGAFLDFLQRTDAPGSIKLDLSERVVIDLTDRDGYPLSNADVRIYHAGKLVHKARTLSDGRALFHPRAVGVDQQAQNFTVEVVPPTGFKPQQQMEQTTFTGRNGLWKLQAPYARPQDPVKLDLLFCLDCTGSMSDEIERIQKTMMQIVAKFNALPGKPKTRWGLVQYRDHGDDYVTRVHDFTDDVGLFQKQLDACKAGGGGDTPESVNDALDKAVENVSWDRGDAIRLVFLIGDASPHMDYANDVKYTESMQKAQRRAIKIYPLAASGLDKTGELIFRQLAQYTLGRFLFISYGSGANASTPHEVRQPNQSNNLDDLIVDIVTGEVNARATPRQQPEVDTWK